MGGGRTLTGKPINAAAVALSLNVLMAMSKY
jgi:hypothetical protein